MFKNTKAAALIATALAVLAGAVAGCGSSGDSATTSAATVSDGDATNAANAAFVRDVEAICNDVNAKFRVLNDRAADVEPYETLGDAAAEMRAAVKQLEAVEPPAEIAPDYARFVEVTAIQADAMAARGRALKVGDDARVGAAQRRGDEANEEQDLIAQGLDLDDCAASAEDDAQQGGSGSMPAAPGAQPFPGS